MSLFHSTERVSLGDCLDVHPLYDLGTYISRLDKIKANCFTSLKFGTSSSSMSNTKNGIWRSQPPQPILRSFRYLTLFGQIPDDTSSEMLTNSLRSHGFLSSPSTLKKPSTGHTWIGAIRSKDTGTWYKSPHFKVWVFACLLCAGVMPGVANIETDDLTKMEDNIFLAGSISAFILFIGSIWLLIVFPRFIKESVSKKKKEKLNLHEDLNIHEKNIATPRCQPRCTRPTPVL